MNREEAIEMWVIPALKNTWNEKRCNEVLDALEQELCEKPVEKQESCEDAELVSVRQELLDRGDEMVSFRQLVERFDEVEEYFKGIPWNLKQIYNNFNILIVEKPCTDAISRQAYDKGFDDGLEEGLKVGACEDCIDRQYLVDKATSWDKHFADSERYVSLTDIQNAPSVTPAEKVGRWIMHIDDLFPAESTMECNKCHEHQPITIDDNYCPNCGAKMQEVEE